MLDINSLPDISELTDIDTNFRVFAGPGAGKTTWLIQHLINILKTSCRLHKTRKIACITYTNVAAEEVLSKLKCDKCRLDGRVPPPSPKPVIIRIYPYSDFSRPISGPDIPSFRADFFIK